ncbi:2Fe-2S iron-sulfur cluster binding domain-containing protein [Breoghania sp.]|uniref:2Fe-2S iron-sulfur cluster-binding protein n=1 Tax=Breoghania sp. TaxID=2065378 RepID=UPI00260E4F57|nr:2Fe-2S iron-sulfur cluster binding domain-containing protein [Breoghania sp.]MDJ0933111.1 2Fe-2S iron-sulfur cluster binding domain-containing protein [Breoghania sp.]
MTVGPDDTIANALIRAGVDVEFKCEEGVCGTRITGILEGEADHRDKFLTLEEQAENCEMAICCSRAKGKRIVLDI